MATSSHPGALSSGLPTITILAHWPTYTDVGTYTHYRYGDTYGDGCTCTSIC
ncbi:MAG: hypothetical protein ACJZ39_04535 [Candidatus Thalassarchaeaceae archaeon]